MGIVRDHQCVFFSLAMRLDYEMDLMNILDTTRSLGKECLSRCLLPKAKVEESVKKVRNDQKGCNTPGQAFVA